MSKAAELAALIGSQTALSNRNLIINGAMQVAQRGTSTTGITSGTAYNTVDRFQFGVINAGTYTIAQSTTTPDGFSFSTKIDCTTADTSVAADHAVFFQQKIEGQNLQLLQKGTSSAKKHTLSFYVKSNKTGTFTVHIKDNDNSRSISKTYTIDSANTWERKTIVIDGDATGALDNDNAYSYQIRWFLAAGSNYTSGTMNSTWASQTTANIVSSSQVNLSDSTDNEWLITGIQLEVGEQATPFEHRLFDDELDRCKRYYQKSFAYDTAPANDTRGDRESEMPPSDSISYAGAIVYLEKAMRAAATCQAYNPQTAPANSGAYINDLVNDTVTTEYAVSSIVATTGKVRFFLSVAPTRGGNPYGCNWTADAEL